MNTEQRLLELLRGKFSSLTISFNEHSVYYEKPGERQESDDWISEEEKAKAIESNSVWTLTWYPDTPVGFYSLCGSSLESVLNAAAKIDREEAK